MEIVFHLVSLFLILYLCIGLIVLYLRTKCSNYSAVWLHSTTSKVLSLSLFRLLVYFCCPLYSFDCFFFAFIFSPSLSILCSYCHFRCICLALLLSPPFLLTLLFPHFLLIRWKLFRFIFVGNSFCGVRSFIVRFTLVKWFYFFLYK